MPAPFRDQTALRPGSSSPGSPASGGRAVGIVANQPKVKGGVLMVDSSDKGARCIWLCNAFNIPLVYLADVPGFMVGAKVERAGIIRHGAKMVFATSQRPCPRSP
jgi:acetyl-CoA carboxylase carboxyltransferase component